jgi:hypothetical protein
MKIHLALDEDEVVLLQTICEFAEQFYKPGDRDQEDMVRRYTDGVLCAEDVYRGGDKWSFDLRRVLEDHWKRWPRISVTEPAPSEPPKCRRSETGWCWTHDKMCGEYDASKFCGCGYPKEHSGDCHAPKEKP